MLNDLIQLAGRTVAETHRRPVFRRTPDGRRVGGAVRRSLAGLTPRELRDIGLETDRDVRRG